MIMKYEWKGPDLIKPIVPTYPMLGAGKVSDEPYIKFFKNGQWVSLLNGSVVGDDRVVPISIGDKVLLIQEGEPQ